MKLSSLVRHSLLVGLSVLVLVFGYAYVRRMFVTPPMDARVHEDSPVLGKEEVIQLRILNATSTPGIAKQTTEYLRRRGFDVVSSENAKEAAGKSSIIRLRADTVAAAKLAYALGIDVQHIRTEIDSSLLLDCSVILGDDFQRLKPFRE